MRYSKAASAITILCVLCLSMVLSSCGSGTYAIGSTVIPLRTDGTPVPLRPGNFVGKSLADIGQYAQKQAIVRHDAVPGTASPQLALVRSVKRQDLPNLGLSCLADWGTIEEPPFILVILKGQFQAQLPASRPTRPAPTNYIAYVYDVWAGDVTSIETGNDSHFKKALNDASLPDEQGPPAVTCPEFRGPRTLHWGDTSPTAALPVGIPYVPVPTHLPGPAPTQVPPIAPPSK